MTCTGVYCKRRAQSPLTLTGVLPRRVLSSPPPMAHHGNYVPPRHCHTGFHPDYSLFANRGAGTFYRLKAEDNDYEAPVRPVGQ